jgi:hypothetical protein
MIPMTITQNNIVNFLIDYRHTLRLRVHQFQLDGLIQRSERVNETIESINVTLTDFATFCVLDLVK